MIIKIETSSEFEYNYINELYGSVLCHFNFYKDDNNYAYIELNTLEDICKLDSMLEDYVNNYEGDKSKICFYFGLLFNHFYDNLILIIKDEFD